MLRVAAMGDVDELNSSIGVLLTEPMPEPLRGDLIEIQHDLFDLGGELCIPGYSMIKEAHVARLDDRLAHYNADSPRLAEFVLPGGSRAAALAHVSRTVCRRATRGGCTGGQRSGSCRGAAVPESPVGPAVRVARARTVMPAEPTFCGGMRRSAN